MKKIYLFLTIFCILIFGIDVQAAVDKKGSNQGAAISGIVDGLSNSSFKVAQNDQICLYKSYAEGDMYVVLYFEYYNKIGVGNGKEVEGFVISDITSNFSTVYKSFYKPDSTSYFLVDVPDLASKNIVSVHGNVTAKHWYQPKYNIDYYVYTGSNVWDLCSSMMIEFGSAAVGAGAPVKYRDVDAEVDDYQAGDYVPPSDSSVASIIKAFQDKKTADNLSPEDKNDKTCDINLANKGLPTLKATLQWDNNSSSWYLNASGSKVCFGTPIGYNDIRTQIYDSPDFYDNFKCDDYCISSKVTDNDSSCLAYFVPKKNGQCDENVSGDITGGVHQSGSKIANYVAYENISSSLVISVYKTESGSIRVEGKSDITSKIKNVTDPTIVSKFNGDSKGFPTYINQSGDSYEFSDMRKEGVSQVFINMAAINSSVNWEEEVYETCEDLFGGGFLEFLNETVFKILYIGIPILLIVLTTFDFAKVIFADDKDEIQKAGKKFGKRVVVAILIYLVPTILIFISNLMGADEVKDCAKFFQNIGNSDTSDIDFGE